MHLTELTVEVVVTLTECKVIGVGCSDLLTGDKDACCCLNGGVSNSLNLATSEDCRRGQLTINLDVSDLTDTLAHDVDSCTTRLNRCHNYINVHIASAGARLLASLLILSRTILINVSLFLYKISSIKFPCDGF